MTKNDIQNEAIFRKQACPMTASTNWDPQSDTEQQRIQWFSDFKNLPLSVREGLLSEDVSEAVMELAEKEEIHDPNKIGEISRIVREAFFEKFDEEKTKARVVEKLEIEQEKAGDFIMKIKKVISLVKEVGDREFANSIEKLPIIPALKKYEKLGDQEITESQIQIEISENREFVPPTIKNWLEDYIQNKGAQAHDNLERSDYMYKSKNTEALSTPEREVLSTILRSYDKDELLAINKETQEVVFDAMETNESDAGSVEQKLSFHVKDDSATEKSLAQSGGGGKIKLEPISQEKRRNRTSQYGSSPFDSRKNGDSENRAKFFASQQVGPKTRKTRDSAVSAGNFQTNFGKQKTKHVVDLKGN